MSRAAARCASLTLLLAVGCTLTCSCGAARPTQVLDTVQEIAERASAVKDLERQLLGLHQIFLDMAVLVEAQGEMLDNIETQARACFVLGAAGMCCNVLASDECLPNALQVAKANDYVNQGNKALGQAKELQKDTRKWMCCAMMLLLGICLIVVLAVVKPWQVRTNLLSCVRSRPPSTHVADTPSAQNGIA